MALGQFGLRVRLHISNKKQAIRVVEIIWRHGANYFIKQCGLRFAEAVWWFEAFDRGLMGHYGQGGGTGAGREDRNFPE